jgi:regulator of cell morphogenesis and NO signaling
MGFSGETKVRDIALSSPAARHLLEDAGLDYCCGGGKSLREACHGTHVSADGILARLQEYSRDVRPDAANWASAPLSELTRHICEKHHSYVRAAIPRIGELLTKVNAKHGAKHPELTTTETLFAQVGREMTSHMQKEEQILFPYIETMERAHNGNGSLEPPFFQTVGNPIKAMMNEHDSAGNLVRQIRQASADYAAPADACTSYKALYQALAEFEGDLHLHVHLENNILFPRAVELESTLW